MNYKNMQRSLYYLLFFVLLLQAGFVKAQGELWGVDFLTSQIFKVDGSNPAAANFVQAHKLSTMANGTNPGSLVQGSNGKLYGTAYDGGSFNKGALFEYDPGTATYSKKIDFDGTNGDRGGALTLATNGKFYGTTYQGGTSSEGVLFEYDPTTNTYTKKVDFDGTAKGRGPTAALAQAPNGKLYGLTNSGGASNFGVLYEYDPATSTYTKRVDFTGTANGKSPQGCSLALASNGKFYGVTMNGGTSDMGVLFEFDPTTNVLTKKIDFSGGADGGLTFGSLTLAGNGKLYGNSSFGVNGYGVLFEYDYVTNSYTVKHDFLPDDAGGEVWALTLAGNGKLYGVTGAGGGTGDLGTGALFEYDPTTTTFATKMVFNYPTSNPIHPRYVNQPLLYAQTQTITGFAAIPNKTYGDAPFTVSATGGASGNPVTFISSDPTIATVSGNTVAINGIGTVTITAYQAGNTTYLAAGVPQTFTVSLGPPKTVQSITFNTLADKVVGDAAFSLTGTATSGLTVTYASSNPAVATVSGSTVTVVGAGTTIITASQEGDATFHAAVPVPQALTVNKSNQTITFNALADKSVGDANFNLTATASSSLAVSYTSSNTSVATISGSTVTIAGIGTTIITASQAGNGSYNAATPVSQPLTVNKTNQTITFNTLADKNVGDANFNLTATASSSLAVSYTSSNTSVATVSGNTVTIVGGGTTIITASQAGNTTYSAAPDVQQSLTVNKGNQTITFDALSSKTFGDTPFTLTGTASSGLAVSYVSSNTNVAMVSGNTVIIVGAGSTTITASQAGNANYNAATSVPQTLTVNKANQVITFSALPDKAVGDVPFNLTATASSGLPVTYLNGTASVATLSGSTVTIVGVGTTSFLARQSGNSNYNAATPVAQGLTVNRIPQSISNFTFLPPKNVDDAPFELTATASSGLPVTYTSSNTSVATISGSTLTIVGGGSATINAMQGGNDIYAPSVTWALPLIVNRLDQAISFSTLPTKTVGDVPFNLTGSANSGLPLTYTSNNTSVATVSGNTVTIVGAGTATITATQAGNANYNLATPVARLLTVNKLNQTIAFSGLASETVGDAAFDLTATANSGLPVSFTSSNPSVATIAGSTVTIVGEGSTIITALQPGDATYNAAISVTQMLTVNKADQTITFPVLADKNLGDADFNLSATASSGLTVAYASSNTSVATVSGNTVTIVGVGTSIITASQPGNANFNAAVSVTQSLIVNKTNQSITFAALADKNVGDANFNLTATASSGLAVAYTSSNTSVATVSGNTVTIVGAGTSIITATQAGNIDYSAAPEVSQPLTVNVGSQAITFGALSAKTYGDASFALNATASSGLPVNYVSSNTSVATISGSMVNIVGAGSTTITTSQAGNANYNAATPVQQTLTVNKANQTIIFNALPDQTIDGGVLILEAIGGPSGNPVTFSSSDPYTADNIGNSLIPLIGGTVTITASQAGNENYNPATDVQQTLTIHKADQVIEFPPLDNRKVGDEPFLLDAASTSGWELTLTSSNPDVATISYGYVIIVGPGTTTITASQEGSNRYNPAADVQQTLTVNKGDQTITFNTLPAKLTTDAAFNLTATVNSGLPISYASSNTSVATISGSTVTIVGPGTTTITASQAGNANYNAAMSVPQDLTIIGNTTKTDQTITFTALADKNVGDAAFSLTASATSGLPVSYTSSNTAVATVSGNTVTIVGGGSTIITASQSGNGTYNAASPVPQLLTVNKLNQTITFNTLANKAVGDPAFSLSATTSSGLPVTYASSNASVATISGSTVTIIGAGTTIITASQSGNASYYPADNVSQSLTITAGSKTDQTITFNALENKTFGESDFSLAATASSSLPVSYVSSNHSVATVSGNTVTITGVGITIITASQPGNTSYNAAVDVPRTLTVNKLPQTITFEALSDKTYGDPNFTLSATASSGLPVSYESSDPSVAVISGNTVIILGVGSATITAYQSGNSNYDAAEDVSQVLTVNKKDQSISFSSLQSRTVGGVDFSLSATASSGLPVSYASSNTSVVTISGNTVTIVGAGTAVITASQQGDGNFNPATDVQQTLTINDVAANQIITFNELEDKIFGDADFDLTATTTSGLPLTYVSSNTSVATVSGSTVTIVGVGITIITASQPGTGDFLAAAEVSRTLTVSKKDQAIVFNALADKNSGDAAFSLEATASSGLPVSYHATSDKVSVSNNQVTIVKAGRATIVATQTGNASYKEAAPVNQSFCIKPVKPTITLTNADTESPQLISSAQEGNQWFRNGIAIPDATSATFTATEPGEYSLQVTVDDCISDFSDIQALIVTGSEAYFDDRSIELYPNPASDWLTVSLAGIPGKKQVAILQPDGKEAATQEVDGDEARFRVTDYARGIYFVRVRTGNAMRMIRFAKH